ncbi:glutathione S-transferase family protein [Thalassotalea sp. G20_0]|uniref:glutathione S-transferase family protein n=1 Tax=Thalassotalea sp. G20_0 TaxID=2821093 RepID=UPI00336ABBC6
MYKVYGDAQSGNCYKIKLLMSHLDIDCEWEHTNILGGGTHTDEFLAMNPNGKIPVMALPDGNYLWESNAILNYLADGTDYLPSDPFLRAKVLQWQFFEQYSHEPYIATARFIVKFLGRPKKHEAALQAKKASGYKALQVMETHLEHHDWLVGDQMTIADISLYGYTHIAPEGGYGLTDFPFITAWLKRVGEHPKHVKMG